MHLGAVEIPAFTVVAGIDSQFVEATQGGHLVFLGHRLVST